MSAVHESAPDDQQLVRYLLGLLPDADTEQLDELSITDDDIAWRLRAVENDLIDAYVAGALEANLLEPFTAAYLSSPERRDKVAFAASLLRTIDRAGGPTNSRSRISAVPAPSVDQDTAAPRKEPSSEPGARDSSAWKLLAVAALVVLTSGTLILQNARLRNELREQQRAIAALDSRASNIERQHAGSGSAATPAAAGSQAPQAAATAVTSEAARPAPTPTIALVLLPQTRAIGPIATIAVPSGVDRVAIELLLEADDFPSYQVTLKNSGADRALWRSGRIATAQDAAGPRLAVKIPAAVLKAQHYSLALEGVRSNGAAEAIGSYAFQTLRR